MSKEISVAFINQKLKEEFDILAQGKFEDKKLHEYINKVMDNLKKDPNCGIKIPRKLWPKEYLKNYEIINLWKCNLPGGWRLLYIIKENEIEILSIILEWFDHKEYERKFNY